MIQRIAKALGGALIFGSCLPMIAVLPGALATGLGALGIRATGGPFEPVARALAPIAQPLLIIGVLLLLVAALRCSWTATAIVAIGGVLLYVSMYQLPGMTSAGDGHSGMGGMTGMETHPHPESLSDIAGAAGATNAWLFYAGLAMLVGAFVFSFLHDDAERAGRFWPSSMSYISGM